MRKATMAVLLVMAAALVFGLFSMPLAAKADVCVVVQRFTNNTKPTSEINALQRDCNKCTVDCYDDDNCEILRSYDARIMPGDLIAVYPVDRCLFQGMQDPTSTRIAVIIDGLDYAQAVEYASGWWDTTGDVVDGQPVMYTKRMRKYNIDVNNLPGQWKTLFQENSWIELQWSDICGYVTNELTGLSGAMCP